MAIKPATATRDAIRSAMAPPIECPARIVRSALIIPRASSSRRSASPHCSARGMINADRTILAGHSMGGAIAERIASRVQVAGLIAIPPAPMRAAHAVTPEKVLFGDPPDLPPHSLVMVGSLELASMRANAADLVTSRSDGT